MAGKFFDKSGVVDRIVAILSLWSASAWNLGE
jgi:hypothetical protein